jgi:hypothetical protein
LESTLLDPVVHFFFAELVQLSQFEAGETLSLDKSTYMLSRTVHFVAMSFELSKTI